MKHNPTATANAAAATTVVVYVICRFLVGLFPLGMMNIARSWFHGFDIGRISAWNMNTGNFVLGIISSTLTAWLIGYIFAWFYNLFAKK